MDILLILFLLALALVATALVPILFLYLIHLFLDWESSVDRIRKALAVNPFQDLQNRHLAEIAKAEAEAKERRRHSPERLIEERMKVVDQYDKMVRPVLKHLKEADDPENHMGWGVGFSPPTNYNPDFYWGISRTVGGDGDTEPTGIQGFAMVSLVFEEGSNRPIEFACLRCGSPPQRVRCGLTKKELIAALKELFP